MSAAHPYTVGGAAASLLNPDDEEDKDICPVCDGECTCDNRPMVFPQSMSPAQHSIQFIGSSSSSISSLPYPPSKPTPLKIKLTVPPNFLGNKQYGPSSSRFGSSPEMTSALAHDGEASHSITHSSIQSHPPPPKRRGRPDKASIAGRGAVPPVQLASPSPSHITQPFIPKNVGNTKRKRSGPPQKQGLKADRSGPKRTQKRKRRIASDEDDNSSLSDLTDTDHHCDGDDDGGSVSFPTFISASAFSSMESSNSSDSSDLSESETPSFASDSEIEKEEENFIVSEVHQKARLRRELLGDDGLRAHDPHGDWVIRPRKKSVGSSGSEMNVDSDGTGEEEEEEEEEDPDEDAEETDGKSAGAGLVTAWSEDDESSFDADLFFTNLTDSDTNTNSSCSPSEDNGGEDGDHSDMDTASCSDIAELAAQRQESESLQLEVTEGWDGQIVFTNGLSDDRNILDIDFEVDASQFMVEGSSSPAHESDMDASPTSVGISDEGGYEEDDGDDNGDTTDEELVGEDNLPNERAMKMFSLPFNVSAINPLSTVSPVVSPAPFRRTPFGGHGCLGAPKPEDILSGKVYWDSDDHDRDSLEEKRTSRGQGSGKGSSPRTGLFVPVQETRRAIIDGSKEVPSPHPRFNRHRSRSDASSVNLVEQMLRKHMLTSRSMSTFTTASELLSPLQPLSSDNDFGSSSSLALATLSEEFEPLTGTIGLDDVLEASFLAPESSEHAGSANSRSKRAVESTDEDDVLASGKHLQNLSRWDLISVGAFRQTRENGGWRSDCTHPHTPHSSVDYGSIMKASPLSSIMWPKEKKAKEKEREKAKEKERRRRKRQDPMIISPVILPVRDGDRTPTGSGNQQQNDLDHKSNKHSRRKETKRERKLKKKSWGPVHHQHSHHQWHHTHQHHPNTKTRGSAAAQRPFLAAVPPFNL